MTVRTARIAYSVLIDTETSASSVQPRNSCSRVLFYARPKSNGPAICLPRPAADLAPCR